MPRAALRGLAIVALVAFVAFPEHRVYAGWEYDCGECYVDGGSGHTSPRIDVKIGRNHTSIGWDEDLVRGHANDRCSTGSHCRYAVVRRVSGPAPPDPWAALLRYRVVTNH